jgi:hypothetical protein
MNYLILSSVFAAFALGLVLVWRKGARGNRADRTTYYAVRAHKDSDRNVSDGWWTVIVVSTILLGASDD